MFVGKKLHRILTHLGSEATAENTLRTLPAVESQLVSFFTTF